MSTTKIKLNCDIGESFGAWKMGNDEKIMPYIDQANIACGFHASDPLTMQKTIALAVQHHVEIGAHPSYPDLVGFGRRSIACSEMELVSLIQYQVGALTALCQANGAKVSYVKPHGALYNDMMKDMGIFTSVCRAVAELNPNLRLMIQALPDMSPYLTIANTFQLTVIEEGFADRAYQDNGRLVSRSKNNAVLTNAEAVVSRCKLFREHGVFKSENEVALPLNITSLCVHGDNDEAIQLVKALRKYLDS